MNHEAESTNAPVGDHSIEATYRRDGKVESVDKITVSADGKQMTNGSAEF
jgi:hypothetical protein